MKSLLLLSLLLVFISGCSTSGFTDEEIKEIVQPEIDIYCGELEGLPATTFCPRCHENEQVYDIVKQGDNYLVKSDLRIIYGSNTHDAYRAMEFIVDKDGNVISSNIEESSCLE